MKHFFLLVSLSTIAACNMPAPAPAGKGALDGRNFRIESFTGGKSEGPEMMQFGHGLVANDVCAQWGFKPAAYTVDDQGNFKFTLTSEQEGRMDWQGQVRDSAVSGTMVWVKEGQADIHYTFQGQEVR